MESIRHLIGGEFLDAASGRTLPVFEPATGQAYAELAAGDATDVDRAVRAAQAAAGDWAALSGPERGRWLERLADALERHMDEFVQAESKDTGKPVQLAAEVDIPRAVANLRFFAGAATHFASESHAMPGAINYTLRQPHGVVACISPWNLPLYLLTWKLAPALAAGNAVVAKPPELTPATATMLGKLAASIDFPAGVLNLVHGVGAEAGQALVDHPQVKAISFTGSTATGARIAASTAPRFKKLSLELGGKNPTLVFADCDFDRAVAETLRGAFSNQGQICLCGSRILVEESLYPRFRDALADAVAGMVPGDPMDPETRTGAVVSEGHMEKILGMIETARADGGTVLTGGGRARVDGRCADGWFVEPTLIEGLAPDCEANQEEIFGPVATLMPFRDEAEALALANGVRYGLAATLWTGDGSRAHRLSERLEAGLVWVNCWMLRDLRVPMGGWKDSGVGREGGLEAMRFFTEAKNVCIRY